MNIQFRLGHSSSEIITEGGAVEDYLTKAYIHNDENHLS